MSWIAFLFIGLALGWVLELLFDWRFWGRRNRSLSAKLNACRSDFQASENKLGEAQAIASQSLTKENEYIECRYDLADQIDKKYNLEMLTEEMSHSLDTSQKRVDQLSAQVAVLRAERDQLHNALEAVNQWVETSMRRRIWDTASWQQGLSRSKDRSVAFTRSIAATAASKIGRAAGRLSGSVSTVKGQNGGTLDQSRPKRLLYRIYCTVWALIGRVSKKATMPQSCSMNK